jgi:hypothetical protein
LQASSKLAGTQDLASSDVALLACITGRFSSDNAVQDGLDDTALTFGSLNPVGVERRPF